MSDMSGRGLLWGLALCLVLPEILLQGADAGLWGDPAWRFWAYRGGAFWPNVLEMQRPETRLQEISMFLSYGLLHTGLWHMALNVVTLFSLGGALLRVVNRRLFLIIYLLSQVAGGLAFAALSEGASPMVGASGALFGLAGALLIANWQSTRSLRDLLWPLLVLFALNVVMLIILDGALSWQAHLGGIICGSLVMLLLGTRTTKAS